MLTVKPGQFIPRHSSDSCLMFLPLNEILLTKPPPSDIIILDTGYNWIPHQISGGIT